MPPKLDIPIFGRRSCWQKHRLLKLTIGGANSISPRPFKNLLGGSFLPCPHSRMFATVRKMFDLVPNTCRGYCLATMTLIELTWPPAPDKDLIGTVNILFLQWKPNLENLFAGRVELPWIRRWRLLGAWKVRVEKIEWKILTKIIQKN
jgi:hypothetical protein